MTLEELYSKAKALSHDERVNLATNAGADIADYLEQRSFSDDDVAQFLIYLAGVFIGADGVADEKEYRIFKDVTGLDISYSEFRGVYDEFCGNREFVEKMDQIVDNFPEEVKVSACYYGLAFIASDSYITGSERAVFEKILD